MTLHELVVATNLRNVVSIPKSIEDLNIENSESFCRFAESRYLKSSFFREDLIEILDRLVCSALPLKDFSLRFIKQNSLGSLKLILTYEIEESF